MQKWVDIMWFLLGVVVLAASFRAIDAQSEELYVGAWSKHLRTEGVNSTHELIAYSNGHWVTGRFENSYDDRTYFFARRFRLYERQDLDVKLNVGLHHGYHFCWLNGYKLCPGVYPEVTYTKYRIQPVVLLFGDALVLSFKVQF